MIEVLTGIEESSGNYVFICLFIEVSLGAKRLHSDAVC